MKTTSHDILLSNILTNVSVAYVDVFYAIRLRVQLYFSKCSKCRPLAFTQARRH